MNPDLEERRLGRRLHQRRRGVLLFLLCLVPMVLIAMTQLPDDEEAMVWAIGIFMVAGTITLATIAFVIRCPRCGASVVFPRGAGWGREQHLDKMIKNLRSARCQSCGLREWKHP